MGAEGGGGFEASRQTTIDSVCPIARADNNDDNQQHILRHENLGLVLMLLEHGADPNLMARHRALAAGADNQALLATSREESILTAVRFGSEQLIGSLLARGAIASLFDGAQTQVRCLCVIE